MANVKASKKERKRNLLSELLLKMMKIHNDTISELRKEYLGV